MTPRRIIKWLAGLGGLCLILLFAAALLLPRIVDSQAVRERIQTFLLTRTNGNVAIENIDLAWFPRPAVIVRGVSLAFADKVSGKIQSIEVYPSLRGLLTGNLDISRVEVASPALSVRLPEPGEEPFNIDAIEGQIRSLLASMASAIPGMAVIVSGGSAEVRIGDRAPVMITGLDGRLVAPPRAMEFQFTSRANLFDSLRVEAKIGATDLATNARIRIDRLRLREAAAALLSPQQKNVDAGDLSLEVVLTAVGFKQFKAAIDGRLPSLALTRGERKTVIEGGAFKGIVSRDEKAINATLEHLGAVAPRFTAAGEWTVDAASSDMRLKLVAREIDVAPVREQALAMAGDVGAVEDLFRHLKGGTIPDVTFESHGRSFAELWQGKNTTVRGTLRDAHIYAAATGIDLQEASGSIAVSGGILEANHFTARHGNIQATDGTLRLALTGPNPPFDLDMRVGADAAELRSLLLRLIAHDGFRTQLAKLHDVKGSLSGRITLGQKADSLSARVSILETAVTGSYDTVPYPIAIKAGRFRYADDRIALEDVNGTVGLSSFSGFGGSLDYAQAPNQIVISSGDLSLDLRQTKELLKPFMVLPKMLADIDFAGGRLNLSKLSLRGPLDEPGRWEFAAAGTLGKIAVKHPELPGVMNLAGGKFSATPAKFTVADAAVELLDAALTVDGSLESPAQSPLNLEATAAGSIGAEMSEWLSRQIALPEQFRLRSPLQVNHGRVLWNGDSDIALQSDLTVAGGPRLSLDVVRGPRNLQIKEIAVADGAQRASMTLDLKQDNFVFSFNGNLQQNLLNRIFQHPPLEGSLIQGDLEVSAFTDAPLRFNARGRLAGRELRLPLRNETATVEFFFLEAEGQSINIRSASLLWQNSHLSFMGKLLPGPKALQLDMDISTDRIAWDELTELFDAETNAGKSKDNLGIPLPPVEGTLRLRADHFTIAGFSSNPFQATVALSPNQTRGEIQRADVCGIGTSGRVDFIDGEIALDLSLDVTEGQLQTASRCLTHNRHTMTGSYTLHAQVRGQGAPEKLLPNLRGQFEFRARDGEFAQSGTVDTALETIFDYLNEKGDVGVAFPDLDRESFPFRSLRVNGTLDGMTLVNRQLAIQSTLYVISGDGRIDLEDRQINARGLVTFRVPGDNLLRRIPLIGSMLNLGGSILGIPIRVVGPLEQPTITYLAPSDVGAELLDIPMRILGLPLEAIRVFTPRDMRRREDNNR